MKNMKKLSVFYKCFIDFKTSYEAKEKIYNHSDINEYIYIDEIFLEINSFQDFKEKETL